MRKAKNPSEEQTPEGFYFLVDYIHQNEHPALLTDAYRSAESDEARRGIKQTTTKVIIGCYFAQSGEFGKAEANFTALLRNGGRGAENGSQDNAFTSVEQIEVFIGEQPFNHTGI
jgi:hypothetical protein